LYLDSAESGTNGCEMMTRVAEALSILKFEKPSSVLPKKKRFFDSA